MTIYLTRTEDNKIQHFRATVKNNGVDIVHGIFYNWLSKYFKGCGSYDSALIIQKQLVDEKIKEGFQVTKFKETLENTADVYDKAKWHFGGEFPNDLDYFQGYVHTGMFLGWIIDNDLISDEFKVDHEEEIKQFKEQKLTGAQIFEYCLDGVLLLEDISELGNRFALPYFNFDSGKYLNDYEKALAKDLPSLYHVENTWDNYKKLKGVLDKRFSDWKNESNKKPFWKFW